MQSLSFLPVLAVANWFIAKAAGRGEPVNPIKLQRLVYHSHCWCLALYDRPLTQEFVEAWRWGPVFPPIYEATKVYGIDPVTSLLSEQFKDFPLVEEGDPRVPLLERIWNVYGSYTHSQLCYLANEQGGPWEWTLMKNPGRKNLIIDEDRIKEWFRAKVHANPQ